ncbi:MAG: T9SS type A sorting domain-containing protein [Bacteroidetes bacterium]|nr:MAG: T9SS type A sorting domain-containing protein [Bacteroidota bacterium]
MARQSARELVVFNQLNLKAYPNPSENVFTLQVESDNLKDKISLRIFDMAGRTIQTFTNLSPGQTLKVGSNYKIGVYFIDMMQGDKHKQVKLVKQ